MRKPKGEFVMYRFDEISMLDGKWRKDVAIRGPVRVMARSEHYAMVRYKGCIPFVIQEKDIIDQKVEGETQC